MQGATGVAWLKVKMQRWENKVAVVTGASAGIGATLVKDLLNSGLIVVGLARRRERVEEIRSDLSQELRSKFHSIRCDVSKGDDVVEAFNWIDDKLGGTDILINNAGVLRFGSTTDPDVTESIRETIDINVMGVVYCTREAFNSMKRRRFDGHIVIVNSILGHEVPASVPNFPSANVYPASKFAVTALTETYRQEFANAGTKVKITSISPGAVYTELVSDDVKKSFEQFNMSWLKPEDISNAILYIISTPPHVQIHELIVRPL